MSRHGHHSPEEASRADDRSRSRSPHRKHHHHHRSHRHRSLSPSHHSHHHHSRTHRRKQTPPPATAAVLPYNEPHLSKHDLSKHRALFGLYLDVQKRLDIDGLEEDERRGRWKSFVGKWNRGELSEGWYDPSTRKRAEAAVAEEGGEGDGGGERRVADERRRGKRASPVYETEAARPTGQRAASSEERSRAETSESGDDEIGPTLPGPSGGGHRRAPGPTIPRSGDLQLQREAQEDDLSLSRADLAFARKQDRLAQKTLLDELVPRADPGSRERQLEKKADVRAFHTDRAAGGGGGVEEVPDSDLLGGEDDGVEGLKKRKGEWERKKNERELRKDEMLRARKEEREERLQEGREKEERVMRGLRALAKERFG